MFSVATVSLKGGVGKTTVTLGIAGAAMQQGLRVLVIDLDPQANATLGLSPPEYRFTINDVLADGREGIAADAITSTGWGPEVELIAAEPSLEHRNTAGTADSALRLRRSLRGVAEDYDLVLMDCPPSLGEITRNGLAATSHAVVVTEPGFFSLRGAQQALEAIAVVRDNTNLRLRALGVIVNRMRPRLAEHKFRLKELRDAYPHLILEPSIPERSVIQQAEGAGVPFQSHNRSGLYVAKVFSDILNEMRHRALPVRKPGDAS